MDAPRIAAPAPGHFPHWPVFALVLLLAAWLRIHHFDRPGLWIDEYGTWWVIAANGYAGVAARAWEVQGQSPFYYLIVRACVDLFGVASWSLRLPSLVFGILVPWLGYFATREIFRDRRLALMAAAALAVHLPLIRYSQEARPYALALALAVGSFAFFVRVLRGGGRVDRIAHALLTAGAVYAHYLFGFALLVQAAHAIGRPGPGRRRALPALAAAGLLAAPGAIQLGNLFARRSALNWVEEPTSVPDALVAVAETFLDPWPLGLAALTVAMLLAFGARSWRGESDDRPGLVVAWLLIPFAVMALAPALFDVNLITRRYLLFAAPAARILVGVLLALPRRGALADALPLLVFTAASFVWVLLPQHARTGTFSFREDQHWDTAVSELLAGYREGDRVLLASRFVEMDLAAAGTASPATRGFVTWPLEAHLPAGVKLPYQPLPYRVTPESRPAFEAGLRRAFAAGRVWLVGAGPTFRAAAAFARQDPLLAFARNERHGEVRLMLLTR